jgi:hypothetical protein
MPRISRPRGAKADRHVGAGLARRFFQPGVLLRQLVEPREQPQCRGRIRRPAAETCRDRQMLGQPEAARPQAVDERRQRVGGAQHEVVGNVARGRRRRPVDVEAERAVRPQGQSIAQAREHHQALELMIAVGAPAQDAQRKIDLGGSLIGKDG